MVFVFSVELKQESLLVTAQVSNPQVTGPSQKNSGYVCGSCGIPISTPQ